MTKKIKTGGRVQGTPNRLTKEIRELLKDIIEKEIVSMPETLKDLEPKEKLEIISKFLPYVLPKIETINITNIENNQKKENNV